MATKRVCGTPGLVEVWFDVDQLLRDFSYRARTAKQGVADSDGLIAAATLSAVEARIDAGSLVLRCMATLPREHERTRPGREPGAAWSPAAQRGSTRSSVAIVRQAPTGNAIQHAARRHAAAIPFELPTAREITVLALVREGRRNREIASLLNISHDAVKTRLKNAMAKLCASNRTHAVTLASQRGLLDDNADIAAAR